MASYSSSTALQSFVTMQRVIESAGDGPGGGGHGRVARRRRALRARA